MELITEEAFYLKMLADIESGIVKIEPLKNPKDVYCGDITYKLSNGWKMEVFSDCDDFDGVSSFTSPDGLEFDFWGEEYPGYEKLKNYRPDDDIAKTIYGIWDFGPR